MGNIQMVGKSVAEMFRGEQPVMTKLAPTFSLKEIATHAVDFWLSTEYCPCRPTASRSIATATDAALQLHQRRRRRDRLFEQLRSLLGHLGMQSTIWSHAGPTWRTRSPSPASPTRPAPAASARDPVVEVLNSDCRAHELDNLYVVDTSVFPSISAVNPALTAMANALRVGDHLLERLAGPGESADPRLLHHARATRRFLVHPPLASPPPWRSSRRRGASQTSSRARSSAARASAGETPMAVLLAVVLARAVLAWISELAPSRSAAAAKSQLRTALVTALPRSPPTRVVNAAAARSRSSRRAGSTPSTATSRCTCRSCCSRSSSRWSCSRRSCRTGSPPRSSPSPFR